MKQIKIQSDYKHAMGNKSGETFHFQNKEVKNSLSILFSAFFRISSITYEIAKSTKEFIDE